jgi:hypothetical protein
LSSWASSKKNGDTQRFQVQQRDPQQVDVERRKFEAEMAEYVCSRCGVVMIGREIGASFEGRCVCRECIAELEAEDSVPEPQQQQQKQPKELPPVTITGFLKESIQNTGAVVGDLGKVRNVSIEDKKDGDGE